MAKMVSAEPSIFTNMVVKVQLSKYGFSQYQSFVFLYLLGTLMSSDRFWHSFCSNPVRAYLCAFMSENGAPIKIEWIDKCLEIK